MARNLDDLDRARPVEHCQLAAAETQLLERQRAFERRELHPQIDLTQAELAERKHVAQNGQIEAAEAEWFCEDGQA
ncbi:hypothetical protein [Promicromonospora panici]|uniref:hypothetical protein n=1 Tax=Promicromonospora panici TaxID=2219658 RepID=UPI00101BEA45|nr:hypothetical protein [Promicromonospora panici]